MISTKKEKYKAIGWFKASYGRNAGKLIVERYYQVLEDGTIQVLDLSRNYFNNQKSFGGAPVRVKSSTKQEWNEKIEILINNLKQII